MRALFSKIAFGAKWFAHMEHFSYKRGQVMTMWSVIESHIDLANQAAWHYSDKTVSKVVPISLRWKIGLFKQIHRDLLPFQDLREQAADLVRLVKARQEDRHWFAHGCLVPRKSKPGSWLLSKGTLQADGDLVFEERRFTVAEVTQLVGDLTSIGVKFSGYAVQVLAQLNKHPSDNQLR